MPIIEFIAMLGASIGLCAKSSYDAKKQANRPEVKMLHDEFEYLYGALPPRKGYNRVLEFDLIHKKIRDDLPVVARDMAKEIDQQILYNITGFGSRYTYPCPREWSEVFQRCRRAGYLPVQKQWFQFLRKEGLDPEDWLEIVEEPITEPSTPSGYASILAMEEMRWDPARESGGRYAAMYEAIQEWRKVKKKVRITQEQYDNNYKGLVPAMRDKWVQKTQPGLSDYRTYVMEYARRSVYEAGYMPVCQPIGHHRRVRTAFGRTDALYDGSIEGNHWTIDWDAGIPDQEQRRILAEADRTHPTTWVHGDSHLNINR